MTRPVDIVRVSTDAWELYRQVRLEALRRSPEAFCTTLTDALARSPASWREQVEASASGDERATFLALDAGEPVGVAAIYRQADDRGAGEMLQVWVTPAWRGTWLAAGLVDALAGWGSVVGVARIVAEVKTDNARARRFYARLGFEEVGTRDDVVAIERPLG